MESHEDLWGTAINHSWERSQSHHAYLTEREEFPLDHHIEEVLVWIRVFGDSRDSDGTNYRAALAEAED